MNSGIHDVHNLAVKLQRILNDGADPDAELDHYTRQRRTVATEFVQAQTIQNKLALESGGGGSQSSQETDLEALLSDETLRRAYLRRQAMITSLEREAQIR